jgi:hypothetical protein
VPSLTKLEKAYPTQKLSIRSLGGRWEYLTTLSKPCISSCISNIEEQALEISEIGLMSPYADIVPGTVTAWPI